MLRWTTLLLAFMPEKCYLLLNTGALSSSQQSEDGRMSLIVRMAGAPGGAAAVGRGGQGVLP